MRKPGKRQLPVLRPVREIEIDGKGMDAASIHKAFEDQAGFGGVTIRGGKTYVTYATDLDPAAMSELRLAESLLTDQPKPEVAEK